VRHDTASKRTPLARMARKQIGIIFAPAGKTDKVTAGTIFKSLERILGSPRGE
jgi:hypothetical protein